MKALTLTQPWASLVSIGAKKIETRSWNTRYRGPLAIHASKMFPIHSRELLEDWQFADPLASKGFERIGDLPLGMVVATCILARTEQIVSSSQEPDSR